MAVNNIIEILKKQNTVYEILIDLSIKMHQAINENDMKKIDALIKEEIAYTMGFSVLERNRMELTSKLSKKANIKSNCFTMKELKKYSNSDQAKTLGDIESKMKGTVATLDHLNTNNQMLIKNRLDWIDYSLKLLGNTERRTINYTKKHKKSTLIDELV